MRIRNFGNQNGNTKLLGLIVMTRDFDHSLASTMKVLQILRMEKGGSLLSKDYHLVNSPFKAHGSTSTIRLGFTMLQRMQRLSLHPVDEICYRFV